MDCYIGLGTNLGQRKANLETGLFALRRRGIPPCAESSVWETEPVGTTDHRWFWNMAIQVVTEGPPSSLLQVLLEIEDEAGRVRNRPNGPRTLDLDLLLAGEVESEGPDLYLPHPRMWSRRFVLEPLAEIAPDLLNPATGRSVAEERARLIDSAAVRCLGSLASCSSEPCIIRPSRRSRSVHEVQIDRR